MISTEDRIRKDKDNRSSFVFYSPFSLHNSAGFTLIELIVVMLIIGISLGLAGIFVSKGSSNLELRRFAREIATTLRYGRNQAVSEKKTYSFVIRESDGTYSLSAEDFSEDNEDYVPKYFLSRHVPEKLKVKFDERGEGYIKIDFFSGGNSSGGVIDIRNEAGRSLLVIVNRLTGRAEIRKKQTDTE